MLGMFERYLLGLGIYHSLMVPFHLASNGQAEQMVGSANEVLVYLDQGELA